MRYARKNTGRSSYRGSSEFRRAKESKDSKAYKAVQAATAAVSISIILGFGAASVYVNKKDEKASEKTVLCEDKIELKDGKSTKEIPDCVDVITGKQDKAKPVSNSSD